MGNPAGVRKKKREKRRKRHENRLFAKLMAVAGVPVGTAPAGAPGAPAPTAKQA